MDEIHADSFFLFERIQLMEHLADSKQYHLALVCPTEQKGGKKPFALLSALPWMTWRYQQLSMHVRKVGSGGANMKMFFF